MKVVQAALAVARAASAPAKLRWIRCVLTGAVRVALGQLAAFNQRAPAACLHAELDFVDRSRCPNLPGPFRQAADSSGDGYAFG